jgi:hypothetical protein
MGAVPNARRTRPKAHMNKGHAEPRLVCKRRSQLPLSGQGPSTKTTDPDLAPIC